MPSRTRPQGSSPTAETGHRRWLVVAGCSLVAAVTWGIGIFSQGVFIAFFVRSAGWSPAALSVGPAAFHLAAGLVGIVVGRVIDRRDPQPILIFGAVTVAAGLLLLGVAEAPWHTYPAFIVIGIGFANIHTVALGKIISVWFVAGRARAMTLATLGSTGGGVAFTPLAARLLESRGQLFAAAALAALAVAVVTPAALLLIGPFPDRTGAEPAGAPGRAERAPVESESDPSAGGGGAPPRVGRPAAYWVLAVALPVGMVAQSGILVHHAVFLARNGFTLVEAATIIAVTTAAAAVGRLLYAIAGDRRTPRQVATVVFTMQGLAFIVLAIGRGSPALIAGSVLFGATMGLVVILQPLLVADVVGQDGFGRAYGPIYFAIRIGAAAGPIVVGLSEQALDGYRPTWFALGVAVLLAGVGLGPGSAREQPIGRRPWRPADHR